MDVNNLVDLVNSFKEGNQEALLTLLNHKYIKSIIDSLYYCKMNYNDLTSSRIFDRDEIVSESYLVLSKRLIKFTTTQPKQVTVFVQMTVRGHIQDLITKKYKIKEFNYDDTYADNDTYNNYDEFENNTIENINDLTIHLHKIILEFPILVDYYIHNLTYEQIATKHSFSKSQAWRLVNEEYTQAKEYLENVLDEEDLLLIKEQYDTVER